MICDEAQKIKSPRTMVTVAAKAQNADFQPFSLKNVIKIKKTVIKLKPKPAKAK